MDKARIAREAERLLPLVHRVLDRYPFVVGEVEHLDTHSNVLFRVVSRAGEQMVLRVGTPHANTRSNIEIEVAWLEALGRDTNLDVVRPLRTSSGAFVVDQIGPGEGVPRRCVLFDWVPGEPLGEHSGSFGYRLMGQMSASLQAHGRDWLPPGGTTALRRWDRVFYYDPDLDPVIIDDPRYGHLFEARRRALVHRAADIAGQAIARAWEDGRPQVVHGDLHEWNVHMARNRIYALDFEDVMYALPAQDVAISLYGSRDRPNRDGMLAAFRRGFETVAEWPVTDEAELDAFHAARQVMLMNYAARTLPEREAIEYLDRVTPWLDSFVREYG